MTPRATRQRRKNFDSEELEHFVNILKNHKNVLQTFDLDAATIEFKAKAWDTITTEFNSKSQCERPVHSLRDKYQNLKKIIRLWLKVGKGISVDDNNMLVFAPTLPTHIKEFSLLYYDMFPAEVKQWALEKKNSYFDNANEQQEDFMSESSNSFENSLNSMQDNKVEKSFLNMLDSSSDEELIPSKRVKKEIDEETPAPSAKKVERRIKRQKHMSLEDLERRLILQKERLIALKITEQKRKMRRNKELHAARMAALTSAKLAENGV